MGRDVPETGGKIKARFVGARFTVVSGIQTSSLTFTLDVYRSATKSKKSEPINVERRAFTGNHEGEKSAE